MGVPPQIILKARLSPHFGVNETVKDALMKTDAELKSDNASAAVETDRQSEACAPSVAGQPGSEAASPADAASGEGAAKAEIAKVVEPSVNSEKMSSPGATGGNNSIGESPVAAGAPASAEIDPLGDALAALERKDYATAQRLFEALGRKDAAQGITDALAALERKDYPAAHGLFEALSLKGSAVARVKRSAQPIPGPARSAAGPARSESVGKEQPNSAGTPLEVIRIEDEAYRRPPQAGGARSRILRPVLFGAGLVLVAIFGASALYGSPTNWTFGAMKGLAIAGLASAVDVVKAPLETIRGPGGREEDFRAALAQVTVRLDRIERDYGARLDALSQRIDQNTSFPSADVSARLERLEKKAAVFAVPGSEYADVAARLDKLEKRSTVAAAPASELADLATRLNRLEKTAAVPIANSAKPPSSATPKQSALVAKAEPSAPNEIARPDSTKPLLRDYSVEDVQDGMAVVDSRYGAQQVAPGDFIPGAGRVLRIERRGRDWFVVTSHGIIASSPGPY